MGGRHSWYERAARQCLLLACALLGLAAVGCASSAGAYPAFGLFAPPATPTLTSTATPEPTLTPTTTPTSTSTSTPTATPTPTSSSTATPTPTRTPVPLAQLITQGLVESGVIALTFDQGVSGAGESVRVLDSLRAEQVRATYFLTGVWAEQNPDLVRRIVSDGHELANHSYDHPDLTKVSEATSVEQMERTETIVQKTAGRTTKPYMRPPFGAFDDRLLALLTRLGYAVVYWTLDSTDWRPESTVESMTHWVVGKATPGDIVVFHGYAPKTADALPAILKGLKAKGYRFGTLSQVLGR